MRKVIITKGHPLRNAKILLSNDYSCESSSQGMLITQPSITKVNYDSPQFLQRIQGNICRPIQPTNGSFKPFMILVDVSYKWSHYCSLSMRNIAFCMLTCTDYNASGTFPIYH